MAESSARVHAISSIREFRGRLIQFLEYAQEALGEAEFEIRRTLDWLQYDMANHWKREIVTGNRKLESAKSELFRAELNAQQSGASTRDERQRVNRIEQQIAHAELKLQLVKKWINQIDRELTMYRGQVNGLASLLGGDLPDACDQLKVTAAQLDRYVQTTMPSDGARSADAADEPADEDDDAPETA